MKQLKALKNLKKAWAGKKLPLLVISVSVLILGGASVKASQTASLSFPPPTGDHVQTMSYELYAGGINAVRTELDVIYKSDDRYSVQMEAWTQGFLGKLAPWRGTFETHGWRMNPEDKPELHKSVAVWRDEMEIKEYKYGKDGSFKDLIVTEEGKDKSPKELDPELVQGTTDALTATLEVLKTVAEGGSCEGTSQVFDGKRRFEMVFIHEETVELKSSRYNVYEGEAQRCSVEVKPVAGKWHEKPCGWASIQEQGRERGSLPTVWVAKVSEDGPAIPIKLRVKTDYGVLFMHLVDYKNGEHEMHLKDG